MHGHNPCKHPGLSQMEMHLPARGPCHSAIMLGRNRRRVAHAKMNSKVFKNCCDLLTCGKEILTAFHIGYKIALSMLQYTTITSHTIKTENSADAHSGDFKKYISEKAMDNNKTWHNVKLHGKNIKTYIFRKPSTHRSVGSVSHDIQVTYKSQPSQ